MLIKTTGRGPDYGKNLIQRRWAFLALLAVGATGLVCYFFLVPGSGISGHARGFYLGGASGITGAALANLLRNEWMLRHPERWKKARIQETDERSQRLTAQAAQLAGVATFFLQALAAFGVTPERMETGWIVRPQAYRTPGRAIVEGDWSNAAPWLCMGAIDGDSVTVKGLDPDSQQGDRAVCRVLGEMGVPIHHTADRYTSHPGRLHPTTVDARDIPDLVPVLAALAASIPGTTIITGAARLRLKESDRLATTAATLNALGGQVEVTDDGLILQGKARLLGGTVDAAGDHRIAMAAAVAACACSEPVVITGAQAVEKSYPTFWHDLRALGKPVEEAP